MPLDRAEHIVCPTCDTLTRHDEMCMHRSPVCVLCCANGEHHWTGGDDYYDPASAA